VFATHVRGIRVGLFCSAASGDYRGELAYSAVVPLLRIEV